MSLCANTLLAQCPFGGPIMVLQPWDVDIPFGHQEHDTRTFTWHLTPFYRFPYYLLYLLLLIIIITNRITYSSGLYNVFSVWSQSHGYIGESNYYWWLCWLLSLWSLAENAKMKQCSWKSFERFLIIVFRYYNCTIWIESASFWYSDSYNIIWKSVVWPIARKYVLSVLWIQTLNLLPLFT